MLVLKIHQSRHKCASVDVLNALRNGFQHFCILQLEQSLSYNPNPIALFRHDASKSWLADRTIGRAFGALCRLCVCPLSVTFYIVAKRYVLAKTCVERIGNQGQKVVFWGSPPYLYFRLYLFD